MTKKHWSCGVVHIYVEEELQGAQIDFWFNGKEQVAILGVWMFVLLCQGKFWILRFQGTLSCVPGYSSKSRSIFSNKIDLQVCE